MKCVAFKNITPGPYDASIDFWDWAMFHGLARRVGTECPARSLFQGEDCQRSLHLTHCVDIKPSVIVPSGFLLVSDSIRIELSNIKSLCFIPVINSKVFSLREQGKKSTRGVVSLEDLYQKYSHQEDHTKELTAYWEVICYRLDDVCEKYKTVRKTVYIDGENPIKTRLSKDMMDEYRWLWDICYILQEEVFDILKPHIDSRFIHSAYFNL
jgi:hypothetical protein